MLPQTVIGWDMGKNKSHLTAVSQQTGEVLKEGKITNDKSEILPWLEGLSRPIRVIFEATGNWQAIYEAIEQDVEEIQMAHPLDVKAIAHARIKTDKIDAGILAHLGRADMVPQAWIPPREVRDWRETLRHRAFLTALATKIKNRIHAYLEKSGIKPPEGFSDLFGLKGLQWLEHVCLRPCPQQSLKQDLRILKMLREEIRQATVHIEALSKTDHRVQLIEPIRGIGVYSAMLILSEIGDVNRFPSPEKLVSYAGLCPSTYQSGNTLRHGRITKQGSRWLRWALVEAATRYHKVPGRLGQFYRRMEKRKGPKVARVALAREILKSVYWCLKKGVVFQEAPQIGVRDASLGV